MLRKINLICVGNLKKEYLKNLERNYLSDINLIVIKESNKEIESNEILKILNRFKEKFCVLFDLKGKLANYYANRISNEFYKGLNVFFIVGGSYGVNYNLSKNCDLVLKISDFTYSHQIFRISSILFIRKIIFNL